MARFLITMLPANDLGLPTRMVPIARALADRGHEVAVFNPAPAPGKLIAEAGLTSLPMPARPMPEPGGHSKAARASESLGGEVEGSRAYFFAVDLAIGYSEYR